MIIDFFCLLPKDKKFIEYTKIEATSKRNCKRVLNVKYGIRVRNLKFIEIFTKKYIEQKKWQVVYLQGNKYKIKVA